MADFGLAQLFQTTTGKSPHRIGRISKEEQDTSGGLQPLVVFNKVNTLIVLGDSWCPRKLEPESAIFYSDEHSTRDLQPQAKTPIVETSRPTSTSIITLDIERYTTTIFFASCTGAPVSIQQISLLSRWSWCRQCYNTLQAFH